MIRYVLPSTDSEGAILFCDPFEIDGRSLELRRDGVRVSLPRNVFDAILYLAKHRDRVVSGHELIEAVWGHMAVSDAMVWWTVSRARKALGQRSSDGEPIETVRGRGYRFAGTVDSIAPRETPHAVSSAPKAILLAALDDAIARHGRLCLVTGNVAVERSRCVGELATMASRLGLSVWVGRCPKRDGRHPFAPWKQVIRDALIERRVGPELEGQLQALLDEPSMSPVPSALSGVAKRLGTAPAEHFWVLERLSWLLFRTADLSPRVVILEDVHHADEASLDLLVFLADELSRFAVLVVATAQSSPQASGAWAKASVRIGACHRIDLPGPKPPARAELRSSRDE